jgi:hypothetical protein
MYLLAKKAKENYYMTDSVFCTVWPKAVAYFVSSTNHHTTHKHNDDGVAEISNFNPPPK